MIPKKIPQNSTFSVQLYTLPVTPLHAICNGEFFYSAELRLKTLQLIPTISPESMWVVLWSFLVKTWIQQNLNIKGTVRFISSDLPCKDCMAMPDLQRDPWKLYSILREFLSRFLLTISWSWTKKFLICFKDSR